ncbi:hypothetical protein CRE_23452 [Caenorhabditis remanei]|uniref:F-box domain-containing protein n=1 Tax=Caenorhabditis remanei TaxID=31234 RepID=E3MGT7_CAERE|nr:hypothetical protein CRE_23452 [Caenorhabditis remanei]
MPELAMTGILDHCDFLDVQRLRKTCRYLHNFIDDVKPDAKIINMSITLTDASICLEFQTKHKFHLEYYNDQYIINEITKKKRVLKYQSARQRFFKDIIYILSHQKSPFINFYVALNCSNRENAPTYHLGLRVFNEENILAILSCFEVKNISILNANGVNELLKLDAVAELEQWKKAKQVDIIHFLVDGDDFRKCSNLEEAYIQFAELRLEHVLLLREIFLNSPAANFFHVGFLSIIERYQLMETLGPPHSETRAAKNWFFRIPGNNESVAVRLTTPCTPHSNSTYLFAYSNDFDNETVLEAAYTVAFNSYYNLNNTKNHFRVFASVRFDTVQDGEIYYNYIGSDFNETVLSHIPDPSLSFPSSETGSDILRVIDRFLKNNIAPVCGSTIFIILKRYPNEYEAQELLSRLQGFHVTLQTLISSEPSGGGTNFRVMYDLSINTNGFSGFSDKFWGNTYDGLANELDANYLFYAVNPTVSGTGSVIMPPALVPESDPNNNFVYSLLEINIQDHPLDDSFNSLNISIHDVATSNTQTIMYGRDNWQFKNANLTFYITSAYIHIGREQQVALSYNYSSSDPQHLQIRMFTKRG